MERAILRKLEEWVTAPDRKPLVLQGARQVGKTWAAMELGRRRFEEVAYIDFMIDEDMKAVFEGSLDPNRLLNAISIRTGRDAGSPRVLVVLDEIQECPRAITSLKALQQSRPEVPIIAAGSLLGVALHGSREGVSFPVGKVDHLRMFPLTFLEFLSAMGEERLADLVSRCEWSLIDAFSGSLTDLLRTYYFVGGMPEAIARYLESKSLVDARKVQSRLLNDYELDFSKYATPALTERIRLVWKALPGLLARENKKFIYSAIREGARARGYEEATQWLCDAGLALRVRRITKPGVPLSGYEDKDAFKVYLHDVGLLGAASGLEASTLVEGNRTFTEFKGALAENYVCQQLRAAGLGLHYWSAGKSSGEVDFVYDHAGKVFPVEVKAEVNLRAKSLRSFVSQYGIDRGIRLSLAAFEEQPWVVNVPLYAANTLPNAIR